MQGMLEYVEGWGLGLKKVTPEQDPEEVRAGHGVMWGKAFQMLFWKWRCKGPKTGNPQCI
jgi:hypothetical protein